MPRTLMLAFALLLSAAWLQAQQYPQKSSKAGGSTSGPTMVEGCLHEASSGTFTLTDKAGMTYQLQGDTAQLKEHNGHEVQITGTNASASSTSPSSSQGMQEHMLTVEKVKHISKTCKATSK
jgi:hypothetical protein